ncbi:hypothetical protein K469DRAFT_703293 [Zopfia rhizophila CBS 207.26]|uniref:Uncharacterized protein n=1 Tax=Zopfia rhizophila CBS 207.26 TaxID=1314779 RepID=A0A6A6ED24_9PEZI|nr:hypothetical protein K469DRAFT_703293 [Zopfia rhizophila CBS 207.26]
MCDSTFTFGQRGDHFFQCPSRKSHTRLPKKLQNLLTSNQISQIHHVTLGFDNSFLITYRDKNGRDHMKSSNIPHELHNFLYAKDSLNLYIRNRQTIRVTIGPYNSSFFAHDGSAYLWMDLPPPLLNAIQSRIKDGTWLDRPRIVAIGAEENFLMITEKNTAVWNLSHYRTLGKMLEFSKTQERGIAEVQSVVLHPYRYQSFVAQSKNGTLIHENLPPHSIADMEGMREPIKRDTEETARRKERAVNRRPSLNHQATLRREWGERKHQLQTETKGYQMKLSLSLDISPGGIARTFGW